MFKHLSIWVLLFSVSLALFCSRQEPLGIAQSSIQDSGGNMLAATHSGSNGVDVFRGEWEGLIHGLSDVPFELKLYFNSVSSDPNSPEDDSRAVLTGFIAISNSDGNKNKPEALLPMSALRIELSEGLYEITVLGNIDLSDDLTVIRLTGTVETGSPSVQDDRITSGEWHTISQEGSWEAAHSNRRVVKGDPIDPSDPSQLFSFESGVNCVKLVSEEQCTRDLLLSVNTNVVSSAVAASTPNGINLILTPYTDIFSPDIDFETQFRFIVVSPMEPSIGMYHFQALDAVGNPILDVSCTDTYLGGYEPEPPLNVNATFTPYEGIYLSWDPVPIIPGAFDPENHIGFYQIELAGLFGANWIPNNSFIIPWEDLTQEGMFGIPLSEFPDGTYSFDVIAFSVAPNGSAGHGLECQTRSSDECVNFLKSGNNITILE